MPYDLGDATRLKASFKDLGGSAADPTSMFFRYRVPGSPPQVITKTYVTDPEVVKDSVGEYHIDLSLDTAGEWKYYAKGTGSLQAASPVKTFSVVDQGF